MSKRKVSVEDKIGCLIRNFGTYDKSRVTIIDDICATAKGYESLAYMSLKRRG